MSGTTAIALTVVVCLGLGSCTSTPSEQEPDPTTTPTNTSISTSTTTTTTPVENSKEQGPLPTLDFVSHYGGSGFDYAVAVDVTGTGDILVAADYRSPDSNNGDVVLLKYSPEGELIWARSWGGDLQDGPLRHSLAVGEDGAAYLGVGIYDPAVAGEGGRDMALLKFDSDGSLIWQKAAIDLHGEQRPHGVVLDGSGNVYVVGHHEAEHVHRVLLLKMNADGDIIWQTALVGDASEGSPYGAAIDTAGNLIVSGVAEEAGEVDALIVKLDSDGTVLWQRSWGVSPHPERATDVVTDSQGNIYVSGPVVGAGNGGDSTFVLKLDGEGSLLWAKIWRVPGNEIWAHGADLDDSGVLVLSGFIGSVVADGESLRNSGYILGVSPEGDLLWQAAVGSSGKESIEGIRLSDHGAVIAVGQGARGEMRVAPLGGEFLRSEIGVEETLLFGIDLDLSLVDPGIDVNDAGGDAGGGSDADAVLIRLLVP